MGNSKSSTVTNGAAGCSLKERISHDYYATDPQALEKLLKIETFHDYVWEPACGEGHLSKVLLRHGYWVKSTDLIDRGYGVGNVDFLRTYEIFRGDIITNPPYNLAVEFVEHALEIVNHGCRVAMFLKLTFLESKSRRALFEKYPPEYVYVSSSRLQCARNGDFSIAGRENAIAYAWYIWRKGFHGEPVIRWFN